jgi:hypothetical protein
MNEIGFAINITWMLRAVLFCVVGSVEIGFRLLQVSWPLVLNWIYSLGVF